MDNCACREQNWGWEIRWRHLVQQARMFLTGGFFLKQQGSAEGETAAHFTIGVRGTSVPTRRR